MFLNFSTYTLKTRFQRLLTPVRDWVIRREYSANQITLISCGLCIGYSILLLWQNASTTLLLFLPVFLFVRMALNALDGMVASETGTQSAIGAVLNEVCDVVSDLVLFGAFTLLVPSPVWLWWVLIILGMLSEFIALAIFQAMGSRPFSGPFGKSDRALYLGVMALLLMVFPKENMLIITYIVFGIVLSVMTSWARVRLVL